VSGNAVPHGASPLDAAAEAARDAGFAPSLCAAAPGEASGLPPSSPAAVLLLAADGARTFAAFEASPEAADGAQDPLDRWSRRLAESLAAAHGARAILPFDGPPWPPFLRWAARAEPVWPSRLGPTLHAARGLWASWRAALVFPDAAPPPPRPDPGPRPCDACAAPCLSACPVFAFAETPEGPRYDAERCAAHVASPAGADCRERGCLARRACPVGAAAAHAPRQAAFHMAAFLGSRPGA